MKHGNNWFLNDLHELTLELYDPVLFCLNFKRDRAGRGLPISPKSKSSKLNPMYGVVVHG